MIPHGPLRGATNGTQFIDDPWGTTRIVTTTVNMNVSSTTVTMSRGMTGEEKKAAKMIEEQHKKTLKKSVLGPKRARWS